MRVSIPQLIYPFMLGLTIGSYMEQEYKKSSIKEKTVISPPEAVNDSIIGEHQMTVKRMTDDYNRVRDLVGKYEVALEDMRIHQVSAYERFIRVAQFKEDYTEEIRTDFINEHRRAIRRSAL